MKKTMGKRMRDILSTKAALLTSLPHNKLVSPRCFCYEIVVVVFFCFVVVDVDVFVEIDVKGYVEVDVKGYVETDVQVVEVYVKFVEVDVKFVKVDVKFVEVDVKFFEVDVKFVEVDVLLFLVFVGTSCNRLEIQIVSLISKTLPTIFYHHSVTHLSYHHSLFCHSFVLSGQHVDHRVFDEGSTHKHQAQHHPNVNRLSGKWPKV